VEDLGRQKTEKDFESKERCKVRMQVMQQIHTQEMLLNTDKANFNLPQTVAQYA